MSGRKLVVNFGFKNPKLRKWSFRILEVYVIGSLLAFVALFSSFAVRQSAVVNGEVFLSQGETIFFQLLSGLCWFLMGLGGVIFALIGLLIFGFWIKEKVKG